MEWDNGQKTEIMILQLITIKKKKQINYFLFSNDSNYPERIGDYDSLKACFFDVMVKHPLQEEKKNLTFYD